MLLAFNAFAVVYDDVIPSGDVPFDIIVENREWNGDKDFDNRHMTSLKIKIPTKGPFDSTTYRFDDLIINDNDGTCTKIYDEENSKFPANITAYFGKTIYYRHCIIKTVLVKIGDEAWYYEIAL